MPSISRSALVSFSTKQMFDLVNDVPSYPQFIPGCVGANIISHLENEMVASMDVEKLGIKKTFVTRNELHDSQLIKLNLVNGPFKHLTGEWVFTSLAENACKIEFNLQFEFTNKLIELAFGKVFNELAINMVNAFVARAKAIYN
ncbi:SRPBCC family protein [Thorsellia kenyensis]|uniref:SRPBCC family protein n=1 Tax=Thorsellia kenyensis TaxID=1549888 RepID=A0ABV6CCG4_9GAMM